MTDNSSAWEKGKAEARKRFGKREKPTTTAAGTDQQDADTSHRDSGAAAGIAEARRRFGKPAGRKTA